LHRSCEKIANGLNSRFECPESALDQLFNIDFQKKYSTLISTFISIILRERACLRADAFFLLA
jgi:hypothetical protein